MDVRIRATANRIEQYQHLLKQDWSIASLEETLALIEDAAGLRVVLPHTEDEPANPSEYPIPPNVREEYRERLEELNTEMRRLAAAEIARRRLTERDQIVMKLTWRCIAFLTFPAFTSKSGAEAGFRLTGDVGFFDDVRGILFQLAADELLPLLRGQKWQRARRDLVNALHFHATNFWHEKPAHQHYLRSVFFQAVGDDDGVGRELLNAYQATGPGEPDLAVKAYSYWSFLLERGRAQEAKDFALHFHRTCPRECLDEAKELVDSSYAALGPRTSGRVGGSTG